MPQISTIGSRLKRMRARGTLVDVRRTGRGAGAGLARADRAGDRAVRRRRRQRHRRPHRARAGVEAGQQADRGREPAGRRRHARRQRGRQGATGRLHHPGAFLLVQFRLFALQEPAVRHAQRLHGGRAARQDADRAGGAAVEGFQDRRRPDRRRQGQARSDELRLRRHRLGVASRGRALPLERRHRRAACAVPRTERGLHRTDGRADRFLLPAARAGAPAREGRPVARARREHGHARAGAAGRADHHGAWD